MCFIFTCLQCKNIIPLSVHMTVKHLTVSTLLLSRQSTPVTISWAMRVTGATSTLNNLKQNLLNKSTHDLKTHKATLIAPVTKVQSSILTFPIVCVGFAHFPVTARESKHKKVFYIKPWRLVIPSDKKISSY